MVYGCNGMIYKRDKNAKRKTENSERKRRGKKERKKEKMVKRQTGKKTKQNRQRVNAGAIVIS